MTHELKVWKKYFQGISDRDKTFEVRKNDRNFDEGDVLTLREWDNVDKKYTGRVCIRKVAYILHGGQFGIEEGYCVMSIK